MTPRAFTIACALTYVATEALRGWWLILTGRGTL